MCSNYLFPSKRNLTLLGVDTSQSNLELKDHVFPSYHAPIILNGSEHFELDIAKFGLLPSWAKELRFSSHTYNARTETVAEKPSFRHAWKYSKFCLVPVQEFYEPKYINGKPHWYTIKRADDLPFTVAGIYEYAVINDQEIRSMSMLTINSDQHPFMNQFHSPEDEKRSIIVITKQLRKDWLQCNHEDTPAFFLDMPLGEFNAMPKSSMKDFRPNAL